MSDDNYEEMLAYFNGFDSKKNGVLDFSEFSELIKGLGFNLDHERLKDGFNKVDTDNNNMIDFEEFISWWGEHK